MFMKKIFTITVIVLMFIASIFAIFQRKYNLTFGDLDKTISQTKNLKITEKIASPKIKNNNLLQASQTPIDDINILDLLNQSKKYTDDVKLTNKALNKNQWRWNIYTYISGNKLIIQNQNSEIYYTFGEDLSNVAILDDDAKYIYTSTSITWYIIDTKNWYIVAKQNLVPLFTTANQYILTIKKNDRYSWRYTMSWKKLFGSWEMIVENFLIDKNTKYILTYDNNTIYIHNLSGQIITNINKLWNEIDGFVIWWKYIYIKYIDNKEKWIISKYDAVWKLIEKIDL